MITVSAGELLSETRTWLASGAAGADHHAFPVLDDAGHLIGVLTRRALLAEEATGLRVRDLIDRPPAAIFDDSTLREAIDHMVVEGVGRLPVVTRADPRRPVEILTRSDVLAAQRRRTDELRIAPGFLDLWPWPRPKAR